MTPDAVERRIVDDVARYGWHVAQVASGMEGPWPAGFAYTVGLTASFGWPELICLGLRIDVLAGLLNAAVAELRRGSQPPAAGAVLRDVIEGRECRLIAVAPRHHALHLGCAIWFARHRGGDHDIRCLQMVWPDRDGMFPFEPGCDAGTRDLQPLLSD